LGKFKNYSKKGSRGQPATTSAYQLGGLRRFLNFFRKFFGDFWSFLDFFGFCFEISTRVVFFLKSPVIKKPTHAPTPATPNYFTVTKAKYIFARYLIFIPYGPASMTDITPELKVPDVSEKYFFSFALPPFRAFVLPPLPFSSLPSHYTLHFAARLPPPLLPFHQPFQAVF
jgi:hypothetical protein